jgi:predicted adenylyl cyclase CyaB
MINLEAKFRLDNLNEARGRAELIGFKFAATLVQRDTFFSIASGKLKLREEHGRGASLIYYQRHTRDVLELSEYTIVPIPEPTATCAMLTAALGVIAVVAKCRTLLMRDNIRLHLDEVDGLGNFGEIEMVLQNQPGVAAADSTTVEQVLAALAVSPGSLIKASYFELAASASASARNNPSNQIELDQPGEVEKAQGKVIGQAPDCLAAVQNRGMSAYRTFVVPSIVAAILPVVKVCQGYFENVGHFLWIRPQLDRTMNDADERSDENLLSPCRAPLEAAEHLNLTRCNPDLLLRFAQSCGQQMRIARIEASAGKGDLSSMTLQPIRAARVDDMEAVPTIENRDQHGGGEVRRVRTRDRHARRMNKLALNALDVVA